MPEQQSDALTPATRLLEKKREMAEVEAALVAQKEEFQLKMETLQQRRDELERKEKSLKEQLLKFEKFLKVRDKEKLGLGYSGTGWVVVVLDGLQWYWMGCSGTGWVVVVLDGL